jgi:short-subunit dehydrogenase
LNKAIIIGASSGIGRELALLLDALGYQVGIAARRQHLLEELRKELHQPALIQQMDLTDPAQAQTQLTTLLEAMGNVDLIVISAGTGQLNPQLDWKLELDTINTNVVGVSAILNTAFHYFLQHGHGHLVAISSIGALRGDVGNPAYNASKAFLSNYLQGLRKKVAKAGLPITITDIKPGFVATAMAQGEGMFWVASPQQAAEQIYTAIKHKRTHAYITRRWRLIAWVMKLLPDSLYHRL